jgi:hypothetical protein
MANLTAVEHLQLFATIKGIPEKYVNCLFPSPNFYLEK